MFWRFVTLAWARMGVFAETEVQFMERFWRDKRALYRYRRRSYRLIHWWLLFVWTVTIGVQYGLLRFGIYSISLGFRLFFVPARTAVDLWVTSPRWRRAFFFFFSIFETVFGILWLREILIDAWDRQVDRLDDKIAKRLAAIHAYLDDDSKNPIIRAFEALVRFDNRLLRRQKRLLRWTVEVFYEEWIRETIPAFYRGRRLAVRKRYHFFRIRYRRFRKWRWRKRYLIYLGKSLPSYLQILWDRLRFFCFRLGLYLYYGWGVVWLAFRFLWKLSTLPFRSTPILGRRRRIIPGHIKQRFRRYRWWYRYFDDIDFDYFADIEKEDPHHPSYAGPKTEAKKENPQRPPEAGPKTEAKKENPQRPPEAGPKTEAKKENPQRPPEAGPQN
jgi:hypothetical protein